MHATGPSIEKVGFNRATPVPVVDVLATLAEVRAVLVDVNDDGSLDRLIERFDRFYGNPDAS